jgi:hypothetical protein
MAVLLPLPLFVHYLLTIGIGYGQFWSHLQWLAALYGICVLGAIGYGAIFVFISVAFKKALVISMAYAVIWDFFVSFTTLAESMQSWVMSYQRRSLFFVAMVERVENFSARSAIIFILVLSAGLLVASGLMLRKKDID